MTDPQTQKERETVPAAPLTGQPSRKAPQAPKPRKVEKRQKGRKG
jgi:hypothetical protein